jgi:hypothetical protein
LSFISTGLSAIGKLVFVGVLLGVFLAAMAGVVYMSLSGAEVKVPDITGKDFVDSEKELAALGLRIRKRADRESTEKINTVIEQLPRAGDTVKSGQWISVVVSKAGLTQDQAPPPSLKNVEQDDSEKIGEMISDKPKKPKANTNSNANTNTKKTTDLNANASTSNSNDAKADTGDDKKDPAGDKKDDKSDKNDKPEGPKPQNTPIQGKPSSQRQPANRP